jgi:hypothetical protein
MCQKHRPIPRIQLLQESFFLIKVEAKKAPDRQELKSFILKK